MHEHHKNGTDDGLAKAVAHCADGDGPTGDASPGTMLFCRGRWPPLVGSLLFTKFVVVHRRPPYEVCHHPSSSAAKGRTSLTPIFPPSLAPFEECRRRCPC